MSVIRAGQGANSVGDFRQVVITTKQDDRMTLEESAGEVTLTLLVCTAACVGAGASISVQLC